MNKLKIGIIMIEEPFYSKLFVQRLLKDFNIEFVILHTDFVSVERILKTFFIYGPFQFAKTVLKVLKNNLFGGEINNLFNKNNVPVFHTGKINSNESLKFIESKNFDILISFNCPEKIKNDILSQPNLYPINIHLGLLPHYRGIFPIFHAFINDEKYVGVTIHVMNANFDDGAIIKQVKIEINKKDDLLSLYQKAFSKIPDLTAETLIEMYNENIEFKTNDKNNSSYFSYPTFKNILTYRSLLWKKRFS